MQLRNPCKWCIVKACCRYKCQKLLDYEFKKKIHQINVRYFKIGIILEGLLGSIFFIAWWLKCN